MNIYLALQVAPESQESPFFLFDDMDTWEGITIAGNRDFTGRQTDAYKLFMDHIEDATDEYERMKARESRAWYRNVTELVNDLFPREKKYSTKELHRWKLLFESYCYCKSSEEDGWKCEALELLTGKKHGHRMISGCMQSEWNEVYYPVEEYDLTDIRHLETEYFNTGSEWLVCESPVEIEDDTEITSDLWDSMVEDFYSLYCYEWNTDGIRREIADSIGLAPEEANKVIMLQHDGYVKHDKYKIA